MKPNYSKKGYEKEASFIRQRWHSNYTHRDLLLRKLETSQIYDTAEEELEETIPKGISTYQTSNIELLQAARQQILDIAFSHKIATSQISNITNYRFYINAPYFDRKGTDHFPLFHFDDPRISAIKDLIFSCEYLRGSPYDPSLLNILVRVYKYGDVLNFHTDRDIFGENIYGVVVENADPSRGLLLKNKRSKLMIEERPGLFWKLSEDARWDYQHGYCSRFLEEDEIVRISISFRFFQRAEQIPSKPFEPFPADFIAQRTLPMEQK